MTGADSPAKVSNRQRIENAKLDEQKKIVSRSLQDFETKTNPELVGKSLESAGAKPEVAKVLKSQKDNEEIVNVMDNAKHNPEIIQKLSDKLIEAKNEDDVADALVEAKLETELTKISDPVERKKVQDESKIAVTFMRTELKAKTME
jgi:hypothetical protein